MNPNEVQEAPETTTPEQIVEDTVVVPRELTFGEKAVGLSFNPSGDERVNRAKVICAELIEILGLNYPLPPSTWAANVLRTAAFNAIIAAQMAVVKFITWKD